MELVRDIKSCLKIKKEQILGVIFGLLMQASYALLAIFINQMVETIENDTFVFSEHAFKILGVLVVTIIVQFIYPYLFRLMFIKADRDTDFFALNRIMQKDVNFFKNNSSGEVFNLTKNVCSDIGSYYASFWPNIIINIFSFVITLGILFYYSYIMALIVLALIIILSILVSKVSNKIANYSKEAIQSQNRVFTNFNELLGNFRIIKMLKQNRYYEETYKTSYSSDYFVKIKHFKLLEALYTALYGILVYLLPLITLVLGILFKDYLMIGLGAVIAMYSVIGNLQEPIRQTAVVIGDYKKNKQNLLSCLESKLICFFTFIKKFLEQPSKQKVLQYEIKNKKIECFYVFNVEIKSIYLIGCKRISTNGYQYKTYVPMSCQIKSINELKDKNIQTLNVIKVTMN